MLAGVGGTAATVFGPPRAIGLQDTGDRLPADDQLVESDGEDPERNPPSLIAHRGFAGLYPENTIGAVEAASFGLDSWRAPSRRADSIEIDVVPTGDDDVVVFHDDELASRDGGERGLTDAEGVV